MCLAACNAGGIGTDSHLHQPCDKQERTRPHGGACHDGTFYLYSTEDVRNLPIYSSKNLVNWTFVGTAFTDASRPQWLPEGGIWAPCINRVGSQYVLYYSKSVWGGEWDAGIGVATSQSPTGPFTDHGNMFISKGTKQNR